MPASVRATSTATSTTSVFNCAKPSGTAQGDVLLAFQSADDGSISQLGTPTGGATWTLLTSRNSGSGFDGKTKVWWKIAGGSEPANYGFSQGGLATGVVAVVAVLDADTSLTPVFASVGNDAFSTSAPSPGISPAGPNDLEFRWVCGNPDSEPVTWTPPPTYSELADIQGGGNETGSLAYRLLDNSAATSTANFTASETVGYRHGFTVAVASAVVPPVRRPMVPTAARFRAANW